MKEAKIRKILQIALDRKGQVLHCNDAREIQHNTWLISFEEDADPITIAAYNQPDEEYLKEIVNELADEKYSKFIRPRTGAQAPNP